MSEIIFDFAVVGAGPAGAYFSYLAAKNNSKVLVFDYSHPREKPCGGGIGAFAFNKFKILDKLKKESKVVYKTQLISPKGKTAMTEGSFAVIVSREKLDSYLLKEAVQSGAKWVKEKVISFKEQNNLWEIKTTNKIYFVKNIVGADGVHSIVRKKFVGSFEPENLGIGAGYHVGNVELDYAIIKFIKKSGYIWVFPNKTGANIGIGTGLSNATQDLFLELDEFIATNFPKGKKVRKFSGLIPIIQDKKVYDLPCAGKNWVLLGDAAGHVDPLTAEGIIYALWSAELAVKAYQQNNLSNFDKLWRKEYGKNLLAGSNLLPTFYRPRTTELIVAFSSKSKTFAKLMFDLFTSQKWYHDIHTHIFKKSLHILFEAIKSNIHRN